MEQLANIDQKQQHQADQSTQTETHTESVMTIFGELTYQETQVLKFPTGILGFPQVQRFVLSPIPDEKLSGLYVLQPLAEDVEHTFIVMPLDNNEVIEESEISDAKARYQFSDTQTHLFGVVTFRRREGVVEATVNLAAPIFVDTKTHQGVQHVFEGRGYPMRHVVLTASSAV